MTPRKELFTKTKEQLQKIPQIELTELYTGQYEKDIKSFPNKSTVCLIKFGHIAYETMFENKQEGEVNVEILLYCKEGWREKYTNTEGTSKEFSEMDLLDAVIDKMQFLEGTNFSSVQIKSESILKKPSEEIMCYQLSFNTKIYRRISYDYIPVKFRFQ